MRLGAYACKLEPGSKAEAAYGEPLIYERHRHRYEVNNQFRRQMEENGLKATGINPKNNLVEIVELEGHPYYVAVQFHPELKSTVESPHPLFISFIKAALTHKTEAEKIIQKAG